VNSATVDEFRTLTGFTKKRAEAAVAARLGRTRFASVQEFADDLGLQPHELARIRDRLTCSRPRRKSFGRRVDL
jgi:DNA uptake protein ComE-like DNA-binding protein